MALMDKFKDVKQKAMDVASSAASKAGEVANKAKENFENAKVEREQRKAEEAAEKERIRAEAEAHSLAMLELCEQRKNDIINKINDNYSDDFDGFFNGKTKEEIFSYVRDFFEKILLPGNSKEQSRILMYPYISDKQMKAIKKSFGENITSSSIVAYIGDTEKQEFLLTYDEFFFKTILPEDNAYFITGSVPTAKVSLFSIKNNTDYYTFYCDDVEIANINSYSKSILDFITLDKFFLDMKNADYEITDEEVHETICKKIGDKIFVEVSNYFDDTNEKLMFFTWTADDGYVALTNEHLIVADKKSGGNVSNIISFYYDEISNLQVYQEKSDVGLESSHDGLGDFLFDVALTSALDSAIDSFTKDICDLKITANGRFISLPGLMKVEADRIIFIYNKFKKVIRLENKRLVNAQVNIQPQVVVAKEDKPDIVDQIKKLSELKDMGILSEDEFNQKKKELLARI